MATEQGHSGEFDLDRTDKLPILTGIALGPEFGEDADAAHNAERAEHSTNVEFDEDLTHKSLPALKPEAQSPVVSTVAGTDAVSAHSDFIRPSSIDLPSLAESVRSVEERIARQQADYETLNRNFQKTREAEQAAAARAALLERDVSAVRSSWENEQARARELEKALLERHTQAEAARVRAEEALLESERFATETRTLRESLASREATVARTLHSLGERDAQLNALTQEHAGARQSLEARGKSHSQLEAELGSAKARGDELSAKLQSAEEGSRALTERFNRTESEVHSLRAELGKTRSVSVSYLERLRTREWRRGFDEGLFRELDARVGKADSGLDEVNAECARLRAQIGTQQAKMAEQAALIEKMQGAASASTATLAAQSHDLKQNEMARADLAQRLSTLEGERDRLSADLAERTAALADARTAASGDVARITQMLASAEQRQAEQTAHAAQQQSDMNGKLSQLHSDHAAKVAAMQGEHIARVSQLQREQADSTSKMQKDHGTQIAQLQSQHSSAMADLITQAEEREQQIAVLMAHLQEARRPLEPVLADVKRLTEELGLKSRALEALTVEAQELRGNLERTRGALEEREFLIRRLERAESNNANVLGRIQTSMERLGSAPIVSAAPPVEVVPQAEWSAELIRVDGDRQTAYTLRRRTRIGRAVGCELQVESTSVSRHHALIVAGPRETVIEDLNSTNGVIVNGRKVSRAFLNDGDLVLIGEVHFRYTTKTQRRAAEPGADLAAPEA